MLFPKGKGELCAAVTEEAVAAMAGKSVPIGRYVQVRLGVKGNTWRLLEKVAKLAGQRDSGELIFDRPGADYLPPNLPLDQRKIPDRRAIVEGRIGDWVSQVADGRTDLRAIVLLQGRKEGVPTGHCLAIISGDKRKGELCIVENRTGPNGRACCVEEISTRIARGVVAGTWEFPGGQVIPVRFRSGKKELWWR